MIENKMIKKLTLSELKELRDIGFRFIKISNSSLDTLLDEYTEVCLDPKFISITRHIGESKSTYNYSSLNKLLDDLNILLESVSDSKDNYTLQVSGLKRSLNLVCQNNKTEILKEEVLNKKCRWINLHNYSGNGTFQIMNLKDSECKGKWKSKSGKTKVTKEHLIQRLEDTLFQRENWTLFRDHENHNIEIEIYK